MNASRFLEITRRYTSLRIAIAGDFCLDRYLEIDPARTETSIETGLEVYNVTNVRSRPGAAGTVLNNLVKLGVGKVFPIGFCGDDGEGLELRRALAALENVDLSHFFATPLRRTFTYCKPLVLAPGKPPRELNRLDTKNWTPTPEAVVRRVLESLDALKSTVDAFIVMDQAPVSGTGVVTSEVIARLADLPGSLPVIADSRRGLGGYPPLIFKMNAAELAALAGTAAPQSGAPADLDAIKRIAIPLARANRRSVFVTLAENGIAGACADGSFDHVPALPVRGPIDIVGAGDCVAANLTTALAAGATEREAMEIAMAASSIVVHCLGDTGAATVREIGALVAG